MKIGQPFNNRYLWKKCRASTERTARYQRPVFSTLPTSLIIMLKLPVHQNRPPVWRKRALSGHFQGYSERGVRSRLVPLQSEHLSLLLVETFTGQTFAKATGQNLLRAWKFGWIFSYSLILTIFCIFDQYFSSDLKGMISWVQNIRRYAKYSTRESFYPLSSRQKKRASRL